MQIIFVMFKLTECISSDSDSDRSFYFDTVAKIEHLKYMRGVKNFWERKSGNSYGYNSLIFEIRTFAFGKKLKSEHIFSFQWIIFSSWKFHFYFCLIKKFFTPLLWFENRCLFSVINSKTKMRMVYAVRCSNLKYKVNLKSLFLEGLMRMSLSSYR